MHTKLKENELYKCLFKYRKLTSDQKKLVRLKGFNYASYWNSETRICERRKNWI